MRWATLLLAVLAYLLGIRTLVYFVLFTSGVVVSKTVDSGPVVDRPIALAVDLTLLLVFAAIHSLMARDPFKRAFARRFPESASRSTYTLVAALSLSVVMWLWLPISSEIWTVEGQPARSLLIGLSVAGWVLAATAYYSIGHLRLFGLRQAWAGFRHLPQDPEPLVASGIYRFLRDPMFLGFAIGMWSTPQMTGGRLLLSAGMSLYLLIGLRFERRDLAVRFGREYLEYVRSRLWSRLVSSLSS